MSTIRRFEEIEGWQMARDLTNRIYKLSSRGPFSRDFALRDQMRRAAVSVLSNIAEGFERDGDKEFAQFLSLAKDSCGELRAQLYVAADLGYVGSEEFSSLSEQAIRISRALSGLIKYLQGSEMRGRKFKSEACRA
jgi:four helix bundle protein